MKKNIPYLVAAVLLWLLFAQAVRGAVISSLAFDEGPHLAVGYATLRTGDFRLQPVHIHPPLANVLAAAPLLLDPSLPDPRSIPGWDIASLSAVTDTVVWQHRPPDGIALAGRLPIILLAVLLGAFVYRWAADLAGWKAGLLALFLYVLDPNIVTHAQVITTDMGVTVFGFVALYCCFKSASRQIGKSANLKWDIGTGLALGAALASKVTAGLLAPLLAVIVLLAGRDAFRLRVRRVIVMGLVAFGVVWAVYGFQVDRVPGLPFPVPAATHVKIYLSLLQHYDEGHPSFLLGMNSTRGWWYYFPVAFLVKTPLPTLMLLVGPLVLGINRWQETSRKSQVAGWALGLFPVVHFATALWSSVDIGYRHLLPILPFLFVFIGAQIAGRKAQGAGDKSQVAGRMPVTLRPAAREYPQDAVSGATKVGSPRHRVTWSLGLLAVLLVWYVVGTARIFPHDLAYFNELAGGPEGGYNWLVDSNLDWGQNLKELKAWMGTQGVKEIYLSQFSPSRPEVYGIQATLLPPSPHAAPFARFDPAPGWYAIGATTLQGAYTPDVDTFAYFRAMTPTASIGHAMFVYHVPEQPRGEWVAQCASPTPPLDADEIKSGFGRNDLRVMQFDCSTSWWYPAKDAPGWYADAVEGGLYVREWFPSAHAIYRPRNWQGGIAAVYRVDSVTTPADRKTHAIAAPGDWPPAQAMTRGPTLAAPVVMTGPLQFAGFWLYENKPAERPSGQIVMFTAWRVMRGADVPLSIMGHLLDAQGRVVSGADGLGVPIEVWQVGDTIVQEHVFKTQDLAPGTYWVETGVYRLDTLERYRILQEGQAVGDRLLLSSIEVKP
jgi:hypothetical protein